MYKVISEKSLIFPLLQREGLGVGCNQIFSNIFQNKALPIYPHISTKILQPPLVVVTPLQSEFTFSSTTLHQVIKAKNACPNSCIKVTSKFIG